MNLDFRTLLIHSAAILLVLSFLPFFFPRSELRGKTYLRFWVISFPLTFLGNIIIAMKGILPDPFPNLFGQLLFKTGSVAILAGILSFKGSRLSLRMAVGIVSALILPLAFFPPLAQGIMLRTSFVSSQSLVLYVVTGYIVLRRRDPRLGRMELLTACFLFIMAFLNAFRLVIIRLYGYAESPQDLPSWDAIVAILYSVSFMGLAFALFSLHSARLAAELREALSSRQLLMREMNHRLKNNLALVDGLLGMTPDFPAHDGSGEEWVEGIRDRIRCVAEVHDLLHVRDDRDAIGLDEYLRRIVDGLVVPAKVAVSTDFTALEVPSSLAVSLGLVANELATNSLKYAFDGREVGQISMSLAGEPGIGIFVLSDDGVGTSWPPERGGFGTTIVTALVAQIGGKLEYRNGGGSTWKVSFPLKPEGTAAKPSAGA